MRFQLFSLVTVLAISAVSAISSIEELHPYPYNETVPVHPSSAKRQTSRDEIVARLARRSRQGFQGRGPKPTDTPTPYVFEVGRISSSLAYNLYFNTTGYAESFNNDGNAWGPGAAPQTTTFDGALSLNQAIFNCADFAYHTDPTDPRMGITYWSFNLYYYETGPNADTYTCTAFFSRQSSSIPFNVADPNIGISLGYSV